MARHQNVIENITGVRKIGNEKAILRSSGLALVARIVLLRCVMVAAADRILVLRRFSGMHAAAR